MRLTCYLIGQKGEFLRTILRVFPFFASNCFAYYNFVPLDTTKGPPKRLCLEAPECISPKMFWDLTPCYYVSDEHTISIFNPLDVEDRLNMETVYFSRTLVSTCESTRCQTPEEQHGQRKTAYCDVFNSITLVSIHALRPCGIKTRRAQGSLQFKTNNDACKLSMFSLQYSKHNGKILFMPILPTSANNFTVD
jgi:hypothetical protein